MENAAPALLVTPKEKQVLIVTREYKIKYNNEEYIIEIGNSSLSNALGFRLKEISSQSKKCYENYFSLEDLQKLNKYFRLFDNIKEAISNIEDIFEEKKVSLKFEKNVNLIFAIKIGKKEETFSLELNKCNLSLQEICDNLSKEINDLKLKIKENETKHQRDKDGILLEIKN